MNKKVWVRPVTVVQQFEANEYVAACGDSGVVYKFVCDAGNKYNDYNVYLADGTPYATSGRDSGGCKTDYYRYTPCGETHKAESDSGFLKGYMYKQSGWDGENTGSKIDVIIWTDNYTDVHCTTKLNMNSWATAKS